MDHRDHVDLIRDGVLGGGPTWADLGSGRGAFTLALAELIGPAGTIYSVDRDERALRDQAQALRAQALGGQALRGQALRGQALGGQAPRDDAASTTVVQLVADFSRPLDLPPLDGIVMANSLHFERDKPAVLGLVRGYLREGGRLVLVEYDADHGNPWVPYPLSFGTWASLAAENGFRGTRKLASVPSRFLGSIYSALSLVSYQPARPRWSATNRRRAA